MTVVLIISGVFLLVLSIIIIEEKKCKNTIKKKDLEMEELKDRLKITEGKYNLLVSRLKERAGETRKKTL